MHKHTLIWFVCLFTATGAGIYLGVRESSNVLADNLTVTSPSTTDVRHPVAAFMAPPYLTTQEAIVKALGIDLAPEDRVSMAPDPSFGMGGQLVVERALPVTIMDGTKKTEVKTWKNTVSELLDEQNVDLGDQDRIDPAVTSELGLNQTITITRVAVTNVEKLQDVPFTSKNQDDPNSPKGTKKTIQKGVNGQNKLTYRVTRENGVEKNRVLINTEKVKEPVQEIIAVGTKPVITVKCYFNDWVIDAAAKNNLDPNTICYRMVRESNGHTDSVNPDGPYEGLFQYDPYFWADVSAKAGYPGASIWDAKSQIYVTAWAWAHGYRGRWPNP